MSPISYSLPTPYQVDEEYKIKEEESNGNQCFKIKILIIFKEEGINIKFCLHLTLHRQNCMENSFMKGKMKNYKKLKKVIHSNLNKITANLKEPLNFPQSQPELRRINSKIASAPLRKKQL